MIAFLFSNAFAMDRKKKETKASIWHCIPLRFD